MPTADEYFFFVFFFMNTTDQVASVFFHGSKSRMNYSTFVAKKKIITKNIRRSFFFFGLASRPNADLINE